MGRSTPTGSCRIPGLVDANGFDPLAPIRYGVLAAIAFNPSVNHPSMQRGPTPPERHRASTRRT